MPPITEELRKAGLDGKTVAELEVDLSARSYSKAEDKLLAELPGSARAREILNALGRIYFADGKYLQTAIAYKKAEKYGGLSAASRFQLAMSYVELKKNSWARDELTRLRNSEPDQPLYLYWLGRLDYDAQKFADAETNFKRALERDQHFVRALDGLALCEEATGNVAEAERDYRMATILNREQASHLSWPPLDFGVMLSKASRFAEAESMLKEAIAIDPKVAKAHYELGRVEEQTAREEAAIREFETASLLDPDDASPLYALARLYRAAGKKELADAALARFRALKRER